jgi:P27 family predicted phage terminase small subunit
MGRRGKLPKAAHTAAPTTAGTGEPLPPPPDWLSPEAAAEYQRTAAASFAITAKDFMTLCSYCEASAEVAEHTRRLRIEGPSIKGHRGSVLNPRVKAREIAQRTLSATAQALGLTPAARARLPVEIDPNAKPEPDSVEAFIAEHGDGPA